MEKRNEATDLVICLADVNEQKAGEILRAWMRRYPLPRHPEFHLKLEPVASGSWRLVIEGPSRSPQALRREESVFPIRLSEVRRAAHELVQEWAESGSGNGARSL